MTAATCGWVTMSMRELDRLKVIEAIIEGRLKPAAAAQRLRLTTRQVHRLVLRYREDGPAGLTSRRRGQPSNRQLSPGLENPAISLIRRNYSDFGPTLAQEKLVECHGLKLAKETVRRIMVDAGMWVPRKQRPPKVYQPRNRRACCGELIQIDDGKPLAFYSDKASVFRSNHKAPQGGDGYTQFGRAMYELNIELRQQQPGQRSCGACEPHSAGSPGQGAAASRNQQHGRRQCLCSPLYGQLQRAFCQAAAL